VTISYTSGENIENTFISSSTQTFAKPATGMAVGKLAILTVFQRGGSNVGDYNWTSGDFTQIGTSQSVGTNLRLALWYKILTAADVDNSLAWTLSWTGSFPGNYAVFLLASTEGFPADPIGAEPTSVGASATTIITFPGFTPQQGGNSAAIIFGCTAAGTVAGSNWSNPAGYATMVTSPGGAATGTWRRGIAGGPLALADNTPISQDTTDVGTTKDTIGARFEVFETVAAGTSVSQDVDFRWRVEEPPAPETLRPTAVSGLSNLTGSHTDIDQDPDGTITDPGLVAP
jgi:hypothetical protein